MVPLPLNLAKDTELLIMSGEQHLEKKDHLNSIALSHPNKILMRPEY
jgi:hypothetical protein